jgi:hypothetical protein
MSEEFKYLDERIETQIKWHSEKANWNKTKYYLAEIITLGAGALIPVINVFDVLSNPNLIRILSAALAALAVFSAGISKLYKFQENWLNFRALAEALRREKELYFYHVGDYESQTDRRQKLLVERVENMLASATSQFVSIQRAEREPLPASPLLSQPEYIASEPPQVPPEPSPESPSPSEGLEDDAGEGQATPPKPGV